MEGTQGVDTLRGRASPIGDLHLRGAGACDYAYVRTQDRGVRSKRFSVPSRADWKDMAEPITFVHAADIHLGASFKGIDSNSSRVARQLIDAIPRAFSTIIETCVQEKVDFLVLSGDTFNEGNISYAAQSCFFKGMQRLNDAEIDVYLCTGNHDPLEGWGRRTQLLPPNVHVFPAGEPGYLLYEKHGVRVGLAGRSFQGRRERSDLSEGLTRSGLERALGPLDYGIGVLHTGIDDGDYAPCTIDALLAASMDYWALGHIHLARSVSDRAPIYYAGSPQGLDINESHRHGCLLVTLKKAAESTIPSITQVETASIAWETRTFDVSPLDDELDLERELVETGQHLLSRHGRPVCLRLHLVGRTPLHGMLAVRQNREDMRDLVSSRCKNGFLWLWMTDIIDDTQPALDIEKLQQADLFPSLIIRQAALMDEGLDDICVALLRDTHRKAHIDTLLESLDEKAALERARTICLDALVGEEDR